MEGKKSRISNIDLVDRISALPDFILGHILSFLPTDKAVATSILSKRWKLAWVTVHSLDFCNRMGQNEKYMEEEKVIEFVRFVNRVLLLNGVGSLNKFSLTCFSVSISPQIISWINTAITRCVHDLCLSVEYVDMPASLFSCDSLRSLVLYGYISIYDTSAVCLPRLESLKINRVRFQSEEGCEKIISGCPILHFLELSIEDVGCDFDNDFTCIISSASLKRLEIYFVYRSKLKLKASSLEYLRLRGSVSEIFVEKSLSSLIEVDFNIDFGERDILNNSIVEAVHAFDCAKFLTLSADVMEALSCATIKLSTDFKRLVKLGTSIKCCHWSSLQDFIQSSNNLEVLTIVQDPDDDGNDLDHDDDGNDPDDDGNNHDHSNWTTPVEVPRCLSTSLKKVVLDGYSGYEDEREMMRYMLKHGSVLEVIQISCDRNKIREKIDLLQEIREFPRKSPACKVKFFERTRKSKIKAM